MKYLAYLNLQSHCYRRYIVHTSVVSDPAHFGGLTSKIPADKIIVNVRFGARKQRLLMDVVLEPSWSFGFFFTHTLEKRRSNIETPHQ